MLADLALLAASVVAVVLYTTLAAAGVPLLAFVWILAIPVYVGWRFAIR